jgi:hypothetical protein
MGEKRVERQRAERRAQSASVQSASVQSANAARQRGAQRGAPAARPPKRFGAAPPVLRAIWTAFSTGWPSPGHNNQVWRKPCYNATQLVYCCRGRPRAPSKLRARRHAKSPRSPPPKRPNATAPPFSPPTSATRASPRSCTFRTPRRRPSSTAGQSARS